MTTSARELHRRYHQALEPLFAAAGDSRPCGLNQWVPADAVPCAAWLTVCLAYSESAAAPALTQYTARARLLALRRDAEVLARAPGFAPSAAVAALGARLDALTDAVLRNVSFRIGKEADMLQTTSASTGAPR